MSVSEGKMMVKHLTEASLRYGSHRCSERATRDVLGVCDLYIVYDNTVIVVYSVAFTVHSVSVY